MRSRSFLTQSWRGSESNCAVALTLRHVAARLQAFTGRQDYVDGSALPVALALDAAAELSGEAVDQPAAEPGIGLPGIETLAVVGDCQQAVPSWGLASASR